MKCVTLYTSLLNRIHNLKKSHDNRCYGQRVPSAPKVTFLLNGTALNLKWWPGGAPRSSTKENPFFLVIRWATLYSQQNQASKEELKKKKKNCKIKIESIGTMIIVQIHRFGKEQKKMNTWYLIMSICIDAITSSSGVSSNLIGLQEWIGKPHQILTLWTQQFWWFDPIDFTVHMLIMKSRLMKII